MKDLICTFKEAIIALRYCISDGGDYRAMTKEVRRLFYPHVKGKLSGRDLLEADEENNLREALSHIDNFYLVEMQCYDQVKQMFENGDINECVELMEDVREAIRNYFEPHNLDAEKLFFYVLSKYIPNQELISLREALQTMPAKKVKWWYEKYCQNHITLKEFFDLIENVVQRKGEKGWNYDNVRK